MTQDFEIWLSANRHLIDEDAVCLFEDSLRCYKTILTAPPTCWRIKG